MNTVHGGIDPVELRSLGLRREQVLDFSASINPLGPSSAVRKSAAGADLASYPDRESTVLREALAARFALSPDGLLVGNGSTELIHLLARACLAPGDRCLIFTPTFGEYEAAAAAAVAEVHCIRAEESNGFLWPVADAIRAVADLRPAIVFLCNPNNPTGVHLDPEAVDEIRHAVAERGLLVLDDAYAPFADCRWDTLPLLQRGNVAILRSMTKDHALAGARLGYLIAQPDVVAAVSRLQHAWSVNAVAQAAGLAALEDDAHIEAARQVIHEAKASLLVELRAMGLSPTPSAANFVMVRVGDAANLRLRLLRRGIAVRDCASFGLPDHIRIAVRRPDECARLVRALREVVADG